MIWAIMARAAPRAKRHLPRPDPKPSLGRMAQILSPKDPAQSAAPMRLLFVCLGNICRSPAAEALVAAHAARTGLILSLDSAGTGDWHRGAPPHPPMIRAALARGLNMNALRARQITQQDFDNFDHIFAMDRQNLADIEHMRPGHSKTPVTLFLAELPRPAGPKQRHPRDVPDPYYSGDYTGVLDLLDRAAAALVARLAAQAKGATPGP